MNLKHVLKKSALLLLAGLMLVGLSAGCSGKPSLDGTGATFPQPLYDLWFREYYRQTGIQVNYGGGGSGQGISDIIGGVVNFAGSDGIPTADQLKQALDAYGELLTIPMTSGAVAIIYNVSGVASGQLNLTGSILADIYLGNITKWNDSKISSLNPSLNLPNVDIVVVRRNGSSGTTNIFTNYLAKVSTEWQSTVGSGNSVNWPKGLGGEGNAGVAGTVKQTPNSIGYVELAYAIQESLSYAKLQNSAGKFILPSTESASFASEGVNLPNDMRVMITNSSHADAYPIVGFTWILVYANQPDQVKGKALVDLLWWAIHDGQDKCAELHYARLSSAAVVKAEALIKAIKFEGVALYTG
ncbi:MAG: phosphate ABC transporter substrate-binding protein PstS [Dehalococcoidia bacterium]|nr:phosphate ABC transporter substrate-binding protein PstS [Dehalococcoidia bacterium]